MASVAIRKAGIVGWEPYRLEVVGDVVLVDGAIPHIITRGPKKGQKRWSPLVSPRKTYVTHAEAVEEEKRYEAETGKCGDCFGEGKKVWGWNKDEGTKYRECKKCHGCGKAS